MSYKIIADFTNKCYILKEKKCVQKKTEESKKFKFNVNDIVIVNDNGTGIASYYPVGKIIEIPKYENIYYVVQFVGRRWALVSEENLKKPTNTDIFGKYWDEIDG